MSKKILFLSPYPENRAPSQRLKFEQYFELLKKEGYKLQTLPFVDENFWRILYLPNNLISKFLYTIKGYLNRIFILFSLHKFDIVYVHLWVTPIGPPIFEYLVARLSKFLVYDIDDMVFLGHSSAANKWWEFLKGRNKMIFLMKHANHVITCTPKLDEFVRKYNKSTTDISSTVDTENRYFPIFEYSDKNPIVLGWSGSHSTSKYLYLLSEVLKSLATNYAIKLIVMGDKTFFIDGIDIEAYDWSEAIEIKTLKRFDIGLYPLPDEPWVYGKSGLKAIQYMALGIPTVAQAIGANFRIIENGKNGFLVKNNHEWLTALEQLVASVELREKLGKAGRKTIVESYSVNANLHKYLQIFNSLS